MGMRGGGKSGTTRGQRRVASWDMGRNAHMGSKADSAEVGAK